MNRKNFFKSSAGIILAGIFAKPIIESLEQEKTDAEKMIDGARAIDRKFESDIIELHRLNMESLMKKTMISNESGNWHFKMKTD